jgi:cyanophycinase-like exopeptidase
MVGRINLVGAGEMMASMSSLHRAALARVGGAPKPVFLDTTAAFETNIDAIVEKAVEYYAHHLQTKLAVARYRHKNAPASDIAAAVSEIRNANMIFAGPGSPTYAIHQWRDSPVWEAVVQRFEEGADVFFASAASISLGRWALPVYEIYKAGSDPFWDDGLDLLSYYGLNLAVVPHFDDSSGGENYDSRFCYMGAARFDALQEQLPLDVAILGIDAYTAICFDPNTNEATVSGQGGITLIGDGDEKRFMAGTKVPFDAFHASHRETVHREAPAHLGYAGADTVADEDDDADPAAGLRRAIEGLDKLTGNEKVDLLAHLNVLTAASAGASGEAEGPLVDLVLELRAALREAKRFDLSDKARDMLKELGFEINDTPGGATWTRL